MERTWTKEDYLARKAGWEEVRQIELRERRAATVQERFRDYLRLMEFGRHCGFLENAAQPESAYVWRCGG